MSKKTPYEVLGVGPDADKEVVKRAYRKRSRETHPDRGGSTEEFREVSTAFTLLTDPDRRKRYDETGDDSAPRGRWESELAQAFMATVKDLFLKGNTDKADMVEITKRNLKTEIGNLTTSIKNLEKAEKTLQRVLKRLTDKKGLLAGVLNNEISGTVQAKFPLESRRTDLETALAYLSDCKFDFDKQDVSGWTAASGTSNGLFTFRSM